VPDRRYLSLDGLRGIAALGVFYFHAWLYTKDVPTSLDRTSVADYATHELRLALVSFFVLSGFLLYRPWVKARLERGGRDVPLRAYVRNRVARVAPAYYAALAGSLTLYAIAGTPGVRLPPVEQLPLFLVFGQNFSPDTSLKLNAPMWSLAVEVTFYLLLPVAGWLALRARPTVRAQTLAPIALIVLGVAWNWWIAGRAFGTVGSKTLPAILPYFGLGMLATVLMHGRRPSERMRRAMLLGGLALVLADGVFKALSVNVLDVGQLPAIMRDFPSGIGFALFIAALAAATKEGWFLGGRVLAGMGAISYGFYLWHVPVMLWMRSQGLLPLEPVTGALAALLPSLALALASWLWLEKPALAWAQRRRALDSPQDPVREPHPRPPEPALTGAGARER
jgi:peptidoglycan/LPS O-acetylase OafA/YrhL